MAPRLARRTMLAAALAAFGAPAFADLAATFERLRPSVLPVGTFNPTDSPRFGYRGTGFVVGDGTLVATNAHVLPAGADGGDSGPRIVVLAGRGVSGHETGDLRPARVVARDTSHDLALLKIEGAALPALVLDNADSAREGQAVGLIGFPLGGALGFAPVLHRGIVASRTQAALPAPNSRSLDARAVARLREGNVALLQLDAVAYPGNSGGPLFDADSGTVVGIVTMGLVKDTRESAISQPTGITYAVPVRYLLDLLAEAGAAVPQTR